MDCAEEVSLLRRDLSCVSGIRELRFDVIQSKLTVEFDAGMTSVAAISKIIESLGMTAEEWREELAGQAGFWERRGRLVMTVLSGAGLLGAIVDDAIASGNPFLAFLTQGEAGDQTGWLRVFLYGVALVAGGWYAMPKAWLSLRHLRADMNVLLAVSVAGALVLGEYSEAATVCFLYAVAGLLESWSMGQARHQIQTLLQTAPGEALVKHGDHEHRTPVGKLKPGMVVVVQPGERIPCDGDVVAGHSAVDQALLTGESVPVAKMTGDGVMAGTMNCNGVLEIRISREARDTTLARVLRMVEESHHRRAPVEQWIEKFARYYTPVMIGLGISVAVLPALLGGNWQHWFYQGMVVLLISCPCALVISTPVTVVAALTSAARRGVLVKGGAFLEAAARLKVLAFDKTGVLTAGDPEVRAVFPRNGASAEEVLAVLHGLERHSEHPLGRAIVHYAELRDVPPLSFDDVEALPGRGVLGVTGGKEYWIGSIRMLKERVGEFDVDTQGFEGSIVACGSGDRLWALLDVVDRVRPESRDVLQKLKVLGVGRVVMLTGDHSRLASRVSAQLGLDATYADLLPPEKAEQIRRYREELGATAMVGDGLNDAQAIGSASVGIALGARGTDVALEKADIVLMGNGLVQLPFLIQHAQRALGIVQENIAIALCLKAAFLVLAVFGAATLWMAILADTGATLLVTFNGLRMLRAVEPWENPRSRHL